MTKKIVRTSVLDEIIRQKYSFKKRYPKDIEDDSGTGIIFCVDEKNDRYYCEHETYVYSGGIITCTTKNRELVIDFELAKTKKFNDYTEELIMTKVARYFVRKMIRDGIIKFNE